MNKKITLITKNIFKYALLSIPLLFFTYCQNIEEDVVFVEEAKLTKDSKIVSLMAQAINSDSDKKTFTKSDINDQCTEFLYPMTFELYKGDNPTPTIVTINSDEELIAFLETLTTEVRFYIHYPITLVDVDGVETVINDLTDFEGTLQMLVDACQGYDDDDSDDDDSDDNDSDDDDSDDNDSDDDDSDDDDSDDDEYDYCQNNNKKVYICHKGQTICVSINAIWGHLNQHEEDYLGQCE